MLVSYLSFAAAVFSLLLAFSSCSRKKRSFATWLFLRRHDQSSALTACLPGWVCALLSFRTCFAV